MGSYASSTAIDGSDVDLVVVAIQPGLSLQDLAWVWAYAKQHDIPLLPLYDLGYTSIGCEPCTSVPLDPSNPRSGRWQGKKFECGTPSKPRNTEPGRVRRGEESAGARKEAFAAVYATCPN